MMILLSFSPKTKALVSIPLIPSHLLNAQEKHTNYFQTFRPTFPLRSQIPTRFISMNRKGLFIEKCRKDDSPTHTEEEEDNNGALQAVLKLYDSIKNRNIMELSEVFGDDCQCGCNFIPFFRSFRGKKQVLAFFSYLMRSLGSNIEFVVQPTLQDGMNVGVSWRLEWNKKRVPLGKGFSFHICQVYQGKVLISNVEMFMESLLRTEEIVLKLVASMIRLMEKKSSFVFVEGKISKRAIYSLLALLLGASLLFFS
ncbi:uncharacterized protein LOC116207338 [Punica granatum]|uniref:Uncharacterized protein LOC116207338 n=1 Tax=Punica granatum TaxID=22663 RepID=A0A218XKV9_PUNGR|nr:uncharacterized protein LOC116207338 [Punica granatum]OWM85617.1 hypothetical protein CDL15_Pgr029040 [Punica granatum]